MPDRSPTQKPFSFVGNNGCKFTVYGASAEEALLEHLRVQSKLANHRLSFEEADNPDNAIMVDPEEFVSYFGSFEAAAETAWGAVLASKKKDEQFVFKMNDDSSRFTGYGKSEGEVLLAHLIEKTKQVGHRLSFEQANDPKYVVMVKPSTYALVFGTFEQAADMAWRHVCIEERV